MAKTIVKATPAGSVRRISPDAEDTTQSVEESASPAVGTKESPPTNPAPKTVLPFEGQISVETPVEAAVAQNATFSPNDLVTIVVLNEVNSPPTIGNFRFLDYGIAQLLPGQRIRIPYFVANVLVDKKIASLVAQNV